MTRTHKRIVGRPGHHSVPLTASELSVNQLKVNRLEIDDGLLVFRNLDLVGKRLLLAIAEFMKSLPGDATI